VKQLAGC